MVSKAGNLCAVRYELTRLLNRPIKLQPNPIEHIYNGGKLRAAFLGEPDPKDDYRSEEWIFSTNRAITPGKHNPPKKGFSQISLGWGTFPIDLLFREHPKETLGEKHYDKYGTDLAVLMKIYDVGEEEQIPVHCHPTPEFANEYLNSPNGKNEAWYILGVRGEGKAWIGWKDTMPKERLKKLITSNSPLLRKFMHEITLNEGDVLSVPAGEVHSTGSGVCVLEPQEPTDFSIFVEFQRFQVEEEDAHLGLGWDLALDAINLTSVARADLLARVLPPPRVTYTDLQGNKTENVISEELEAYFGMDKLTVVTGLEYSKVGCHCFTTIQGEGIIQYKGGERGLKRGLSLFIPEPLSTQYSITNQGTEPFIAVRCFPPAP